MARNDPYLPDWEPENQGGEAIFDGTASSTGTAIINEVYGTTDATIEIEGSNDGGSNWVVLTQLTDSSGNTTFSGNWHTQFNRVYVSTNVRRLVITNQASMTGEFAVSGDER